MVMSEDINNSGLMETNTSKFLKTSRGDLHYNEAGQGHPLIMLHGSGPGANSWSNFHQNIAALSRKYRVILLDLPGWGKSYQIDPREFPRQMANAEAVRDLLDGLDIPNAAIIGNSLGGMAALMFAASFPDRITHCITMGCGPLPGLQYPFTPGGRLSEGLQILVDAYRTPNYETFRRLVSIMVYDQNSVRDDIINARLDAALANPAHIENYLLVPIGHPEPASNWDSVADALTRVTTPTLLIHGRDDRVINFEVSLKIMNILQNSSLHVINRCGHWAQLEHAALFNNMVDAFIRSHS